MCKLSSIYQWVDYISLTFFIISILYHLRLQIIITYNKIILRNNTPAVTLSVAQLQNEKNVCCACLWRVAAGVLTHTDTACFSGLMCVYIV